MSDECGFLAEIALRPVAISGAAEFEPRGLALGKGASALEILVASHKTTPSLPALRSAWKARKGGRATPLLLVVLYKDRVALCGPAGDDAPAYLDLDPGQIERICLEALEQPDRHAALRALRDSLPAIKSDLGGIRNEGFLATHELRYGARQRSDWQDSKARSLRILAKRGEELLSGLGFSVEPIDRVTSVLRARDRKVAIAVLLNQNEAPELQTERFSDLSPVAYALAVADRENLPYVVLQYGSKVRVYPTRVGVGVGRRGRTETYVECHTGLLSDDDAAYLWLLCSAEALVDGGSLEQLLESSGRFSGELAKRLRERVYESVVPAIAEGIVNGLSMKNPSAEELSTIYEMTLTVLFRLLFVAYGEDKDLLPYQWNGLYRRRSLKTKAQELLELAESGIEFDDSDTLWSEISRLFRAVDEGNREWGVPAYDGGLFSSDPDVSQPGSLLTDISLQNSVLGPALQALLLVETEEGLGLVDFRSLGVREFGTIYEGLLESELSVAETDLATDKDGLYVPCREGDYCVVTAGDVYLHNASGARKSSGSFFTKSFAVEHLLEEALQPALDDHLERLNAIDDEEVAGSSFFDFRVADIAMGSGHFLVAAVDHIERALAGYLAQRPLPRVRIELASLRRASVESLGSLAEQVEIEDTQLLRRLIARRCIYGVDVNPTAVQLARLAVWIHTFVPGLPLSLLDHNLVQGDSLVGVAQLQEIADVAEAGNVGEKGTLSLYQVDAASMLGDASEHLAQLAAISDATPADLARARKAQDRAREAVRPAQALCDIVAACRVTGSPLPVDVEKWDEIKATLPGSPVHTEAKQQLGDLLPFHFPVAFPEVFLRDRSGFDVIVGNPPWEEAMCDLDEFWGRYIPSFHSMPQREREQLLPEFRERRADLEAEYEKERAYAESLRSVLCSGAYPGMATGHPDLYKAFCWRFWNLVSPNSGRVGVVLPRSALSAKGSTEFRMTLFENADDARITMILNNRQWFFEDVHPQYTIGLVSFSRSKSDSTPVALRGPFSSFERYQEGMQKPSVVFLGSEITTWNDTASLPLLPDENSVEVFRQLRLSPRLDLDDGTSWRARPTQGDFNATWGKPYMDLKSDRCPPGFWPVYKGKSLDIWNSDTGSYYAWADPGVVVPVLQDKRVRGGRTRTSAFSEFSSEWMADLATLPCTQSRIAFRDITRATDTRTVRASLVPPHVLLANQAPYLLWPRGTVYDQAYLLGVLCSIPLDWYARRFVEIHLNFYVFNPLPIPRPEDESPLRTRVIELAGRLASQDSRFENWAAEIGVECGELPSETSFCYVCELDAVVALLYGLSRTQLEHVFASFHDGWDFRDRLDLTLKKYDKWRSK